MEDWRGVAKQKQMGCQLPEVYFSSPLPQTSTSIHTLIPSTYFYHELQRIISGGVENAHLHGIALDMEDDILLEPGLFWCVSEFQPCFVTGL